MLVVETVAKIRRAYFVQGKPIKAICRELRVSRKVVRKVVRSKATEFRYEREDQPLPRLGPLRVGVSIEDRIVAPSTDLKKLAALPKTNMLSRALREIGRIERTLFMIEWYSSPELRDRCRIGLNKGEAGNKLARAVFFHERCEIRDGSFKSQAFRAFGLNLVVSAIVLWNTVHLSLSVNNLRAEGHDLPNDVIRHVSPQIWEHINLTGIYDWMHEPQPEGTFRPLRIAKEKFMAAA